MLKLDGSFFRRDYKLSRNQFLVLLVLVALVMATLIIPWFGVYTLNADLKSYAASLDFIANQTVGAAVFNNTFFFFVIKNFFLGADNFLLINITHNCIVLFLVLILGYYTDLKLTLSVVLLGLFSLFFGQIRAGLSLGFCIVALYKSDKIVLFVLFAILGMLSHFFVFFVFLLLFLFKIGFEGNYSKRNFFFLNIILFLGVMFYLSSDKRYLSYLKIQNDFSFSFLTPLVLFLITKNALGVFKNAFLILIGLAILTLPFYSFSNRLSEILSFIILVFYSYYSNYNSDLREDFILIKAWKVEKINLILFFSMGVFLYKYLNIVIFEGFLRKFVLGANPW